MTSEAHIPHKELPFTTEVKFHVNQTDLLDWPVFMSPEFSYKGISWNLILFVTEYKQLNGKVQYRTTSQVSAGQLEIKIKTNHFGRHVPARNRQKQTWYTFILPFEAGFKGQGLSDLQHLSAVHDYNNQMIYPRSNTYYMGGQQNEAVVTIDIAWECYFSNSPSTDLTILIPSDPQHIIKKLEALLLSEVSTDVIFEVGEENIPAHTLILEAMSAVFSSMFELMDTKDTKRIKVEEATAAGFKRMLRSLYTSQEPDWTQMNNQDLLELLSLAHKYAVVPLLAHCEQRMMGTLNAENVSDRLVAASTLNLEAVMNHIAIFVQNNKQEVLETEKWKNLEENHSRIAIKALRTLLGVNSTNSVQGTDMGREIDYVISKLEVIHSTKKHADMVFVCEEEIIPAHRVILGAMSEVFRSMFELDTEEKKTGFVKVEDSTATGFKQMLRCLYTSQEPEWTSSNEDLLELAYLAEKYALEPLRAHCMRRIVSTLAKENICQMVKATNTLRMQEIMEPICEFLENNSVVFHSSEWKTLEDEHPSIAVKVLHRVLNSVL